MSLCELHNASRILYPSICPQLESFFSYFFCGSLLKETLATLSVDLVSTQPLLSGQMKTLSCSSGQNTTGGSAAERKKIPPAIGVVEDACSSSL